jgi:DNA-binding MarR family transcriptional regulator
VVVLASGAAFPGTTRGSSEEPRTAPHGVTLTATPSAGVAPLPVDFVLSIPPNTTDPAVSWSFGDGSYLNGTGTSVLTPVHDYEASGVFLATASATWPTGTVNASLRIVVSTADLSVGIAANVTNGTTPLTVLFSGSSAGGTGTFVSFLWTFGDGDSGVGQSIRYTFTTPGDFRVVLVVTDSRGDAGSATRWVNVSAAPATNLSNGTGKNSGNGDPPGPGAPWGLLFPGGSILPLLGALLASGALTAWLGSRSVSWRRAPPAPAPRGTGPTSAVSSGPVPSDPPTMVGTAAAPHVTELSPAVPVGAARLPTRLTQERQIANRLIRLLAELPRMAPGDVPGPARTQAGIVTALGAGQSAVSRVLGQLERAGVVSVATMHVAGSPRRVKVYQLTPRGERLGHALRESGVAR